MSVSHPTETHVDGTRTPHQQATSKTTRWTQTVLMVFVVSAACQFDTLAHGQNAPVVAPPPSHEVIVNVDSGLVDNTADHRQVVFEETIEVDDAKWIQLNFSDVILTTGRKQRSVLRITSIKDGAVQILNPTAFEQWQHKSAYFNGNAVTVELLAHPGAEKNCVVIERVIAGEAPDLSPTQNLCDSVDDRVLSFDPRVARIDIGCSAWLFDGRENDMITAGHCAPSMSAVFFNVPRSNSDGSLNFPPPEDQYAICLDSIQFINGGVGNDWCYFGVFDNSNTGLSPLAAQGGSFPIAAPDSSTFNLNDFVRITGFGTTSLPVNPAWNQVQKTDTGSYEGLFGNALRYRPDTTGGNSGSPVIKLGTGIAYGVHTHGGCFSATGFNQGTAFNRPDFLAAIDNPLGACVPPTPPSNDNCEDAIAIGDGSEQFDTRDSTTDGPPLPADCNEGAGLSFVDDIWYEYTATCTGVATFDFCDSNYDTRVAAYLIDEDECPGDLLECNDDSCGLQSEMTLDVVQGESYLIRVGGFNGEGTGTMTITCAGDSTPVHVGMGDGVMIVDGTQAPDMITISQVSDMLQIVVNDELIDTVPLSEVDCIILNGYGGADLIQVDALVLTVINGGFGADMIVGGNLAGMLFGGPGPDLIVGGRADDFINAGKGNDTVFGVLGDDEIIGGSGDDILNGGFGDDQLRGGLGADVLNGQNGEDVLVGNVGADELHGGLDDDQLFGLGGPDEMFGGPGDDELSGGEGFDAMDGGSGVDTSLDDGELEVRIEN